jgi:hypothetical protein
VGTSGVMNVGDHVCGFYWGVRGRDELLLPYLRAGLRLGEHCLGVVHATAESAVMPLLGDEAAVDDWVRSGHLGLWSSARLYGDDGRFSGPDARGRLEAFVAMAAGSDSQSRLVGELGWALEGTEQFDDVIDYESDVNTMDLHRTRVLCLYDLNLFGGRRLGQILKTHPKVMMAGMVLDNPNYLTPEEFAAYRRS